MTGTPSEFESAASSFCVGPRITDHCIGSHNVLSVCKRINQSRLSVVFDQVVFHVTLNKVQYTQVKIVTVVASAELNIDATGHCIG